MRAIFGLLLMVAISVLILSGCVGEEPASPVKSGRTPVVTQLTSNNEVFEANPIYSPDGAWILFESDITGNLDIWRIPTNGGPAQQLTFYTGFDSAPFWSPDGARVVFESDRTGFKNIWVLDVTSPESDPVQVTSGSWDDGDPVWSPDGSRIAFESSRDQDGGTDIWVSPIDGGSATRLTTSGHGIYHRTADWSPDGTTLVFESNREGGYSALYTMPVAGGPVTRITPQEGYEGHPAWSPAGETIVFESRLTGVMEIFTVPASGGETYQVTTGGGFWPRWSPDGKTIIYCVFGDPEPNIWAVEVDW
jgi:Tol biopolymer transport system component